MKVTILFLSAIPLVAYTMYFFLEEVAYYSKFRTGLLNFLMAMLWFVYIASWFVIPACDLAKYTIVWEENNGNVYQYEPMYYTNDIAEEKYFEYIDEDGNISTHTLYEESFPENVQYLDDDSRNDANKGTIKAVCVSNKDEPYVAVSGDVEYCNTSYRYNEIDETDGVEG